MVRITWNNTIFFAVLSIEGHTEYSCEDFQSKDIRSVVRQGRDIADSRSDFLVRLLLKTRGPSKHSHRHTTRVGQVPPLGRSVSGIMLFILTCFESFSQIFREAFAEEITRVE